MGWKKRVREIARSNPNGLHPILKRGLLHNAGRNPAWYRSEWNTDPEQRKNANLAVRTVLRWLDGKKLLSPQGNAALNAAEASVIEDLSLTRSQVLDRGAAFLDRSFDAWFDDYGINLIIDPKLEAMATAGLEELWSGKRT